MARLDEIDKRYFLMVHPYDTVGNVGESDIAVSCPICMEGKSWKRKHRLHLYTKDTYDNAAIACFNCGYRANLYNYLKENHPSEFALYKNEKRSLGFNELKMKNLKEKPKQAKEPDIDIGLDFASVVPEEKKYIETTKVTENDLEEGHEEKATSIQEINSISIGLDFGTPVSPAKKSNIQKEPIKVVDTKIEPILIDPVGNLTKLPQEALDYIRNRGIEPKEDWLYSPKNNKIKFNETTQFLSEFIIIPLTIGNKWYGFQALAYKQKKFFVYMVTGNQGWKVWNWDNIDKEKPVYIFESIYDAMSSGLDNVIAQLGANLSEDRIKDLKEPIFCLDNQVVDEKSKEETLKYLEKGYKCFLWPENTPEKFKDTNDLRKVNVPFEKIANLIKSNIFSGMKGIIKLKMNYN